MQAQPLPEDRILTVPQVAKYLQISRAKAFRLVQLGKIRCIRIGKNVRVRWSDLQDYLNDMTSGGGK